MSPKTWEQHWAELRKKAARVPCHGCGRLVPLRTQTRPVMHHCPHGKPCAMASKTPRAWRYCIKCQASVEPLQ
jgi:hypothetical protein